MPEEIQDFTKKTEVDIAYYVLQHKGATMYDKDPVLDVIEKKHMPVQFHAAAISEVYTLINMDSRFHYEGDGQWGLTEWNPPETKRHTRSSSSSSSSSTSRSSSKASRRKEKLFESIQE